MYVAISEWTLGNSVWGPLPFLLDFILGHWWNNFKFCQCFLKLFFVWNSKSQVPCSNSWVPLSDFRVPLLDSQVLWSESEHGTWESQGCIFSQEILIFQSPIWPYSYFSRTSYWKYSDFQKKSVFTYIIGYISLQKSGAVLFIFQITSNFLFFRKPLKFSIFQKKNSRIFYSSVSSLAHLNGNIYTPCVWKNYMVQ